MKNWLHRCVLGLALAATAGTVAFVSLPHRALAQQVASGDALKEQAFRALRAGEFDRTSDLLNHAAELLKDPTVKMMAQWASQYESERQGFVAERHKQFDKALADLKLLQEHHKDQYAIDAVSRAYLYADDKKAFCKEQWVDDIVQATIADAAKHEAAEQWLPALRLYSELSSVEPANPLWKDKLKAATRRIRLLAMYTPDELRDLQDAQAKERKEVDDLLRPTTQPAAKPPSTEPANDSFRIDWKESLKGIRMEMLSEALFDARLNYYRDVPQRNILTGGLNAVRAVTTTKGLEKAFTGLADKEKLADFTTRLDAICDTVKDWGGGNETELKQKVLSRLRNANSDTINLPEQVLVNEFADGAFAELDPFSNMIWPSDKEEFNKTTTGEFSGVGIQIESEHGDLRVVSPLEDSPAYKAGIKAGDIISAINGKNAKGITLNQAVKTITGPSGTTVMLTVRSQDGGVKDYTIKRETIKVASIKGWLHKPGGGWEYFVDPQQKIAYIRLTNFTKTTSEELDKAAVELSHQGAKALILDLRNNPGGLLTAATETCDKFLSKGVIVSTKADRETPNPPTVAKAKQDDDEITIPMAVLVNQYSASASEIVSGALKDQDRALIVGERTFGKGSVQMLFPLMDHAAYLKLTTSHYYLPSGRCIHREENSTDWGVDPDVKVEMTPEQMRVAIIARQELDVLRDASDPNPPATRPTTETNSEDEQALAKARKDPLGSDSQLSAALLLLRMRLAGADF